MVHVTKCILINFITIARRSIVIVGLRIWHVWRRALPILRCRAGRRHLIATCLIAVHCNHTSILSNVVNQIFDNGNHAEFLFEILK